jgi:Reverse transcriptase (RNA-dependent DNA polymerase)
MTLCRDEITHRLIGRGSDHRHLGRWTWLRFRGKHDLSLRIVTIYRPVVSRGAMSAYKQQQTFLLSQDISECPRSMFLNDLHQQLTQWQEEGDQIILGGDFNEFIGSRTLQQFFKALGMRELLTSKHGPAPNTHAAGSVAIDGIFATGTIQITHGGYSSVDWGSASDHRLCWIDIELSLSLGTALPRIWLPVARKLKLMDPRVVQRFIELRKGYESDHNLLQRLRLIHQAVVTRTTTPEHLLELEELDQLRTQSILMANDKCRKLRMGNVAWSPVFQSASNKIQYLKSCIRCYHPTVKHNRISSRTLQKQRIKAKIADPVLDFETAVTRLKEAYRNYNMIKSEAKEHRQSYLRTVAAAIEENGGGDANIVYEQMVTRERQKELSRKLKLLKGKNKGILTRVEVPYNGGWKEVCGQVDIIDGCMAENIRRFTQANSTPSLQQDSIRLLGWTADTTYANSILQGTADTNMLTPEMRKIIPHFSMPESIANVGEISTDISPEEYIYSWSRTREYTTTGRSGIHFGHMKASCLDATLVETDRLFLEIALKSGYSLDRWKQGIDFFIPKKEDSIKVTKLRTIILFECDFNHLNKIVARRVMRQGEQAQTIALEQYGSRKRKSAILHATNKQLTFDIIRQRKLNASLLVLDAISCYDRISAPMAALSLRRQGTPSTTVSVMFKTLDAMKHYIRTASGDSETFYSNETHGIRMHGILQGNGAGPMIWAMLSTPLLEYMRSKGFGVNISNSETGDSFLVTAFSFVDDTDFIQSLNNQNSPSEETQQTLNNWVDALQCSGGDVSGEKVTGTQCCTHGTTTNGAYSKLHNPLV